MARDQSREDWLDAAREVLVKSGVETVSIAALARTKGLTRGAFYWHFENREALLNALLPMLAANAEPDALVSLDRAGFEDGMLAIFDTVFAPNQIDLQATEHDRALRRWAETDADAAKITSAATHRRLSQVERFFVRFGYGPTEARIRASMICALFLDGASRTALLGRLSYPTDLKSLFAYFTGRDIKDSVLSCHLNQTLPRRRMKALRVCPAEPGAPQVAPQPPSRRSE